MRLFARTFAALSLALTTLAALAAAPITGSVINKTNGKPAGGDDDVVLIQLQQGMQESTRTKTDARGHFSLDVPDEGMHLVRVTHQKANYFQPVQPGTQTVEVSVYDAAPQVEGVSLNVQEMHVEATPTELHVVEVLQVMNTSSPQRTQFGPHGFEFYLPKGALVGRTGAITQGGMPVQTPAVPVGDPGHYAFLFPIRPGETQFGIAYTLPYTGKFTFTPQVTTPVKTFAVLVPTAMTLTAGAGGLQHTQPGKPGTQTYLAQDVAAGAGPQFTISGTGSLPDSAPADNAGPNASTANPGASSDAAAPGVSNSDLAGGRGLNNPLDESGDRDPWSKYKWWILSGLALLLAVAAGVLLRKPAGTSAPTAGLPPVPLSPRPLAPVAAAHAAAVHAHGDTLAALKEELFALETERLQKRITEAQYREAKNALELILGRVLTRLDGPVPASAGTVKEEELARTPALSGQERA